MPRFVEPPSVPLPMTPASPNAVLQRYIRQQHVQVTNDDFDEPLLPPDARADRRAVESPECQYYYHGITREKAESLLTGCKVSTNQYVVLFQ